MTPLPYVPCTYSFADQNVFDRRPVVYSSSTNFTLISVYCRPAGVNGHNTAILAIFEVRGLLYPPLHRSGKYLAWESGPTMYSIMPNFSLIGVHCQPYWAKTANLTTFWTSGALSPPLDRSGPNLASQSRTIVYDFVPNFIWTGLLWRSLRAKNPKFDPIFNFFYISWWRSLAEFRHSWTRVHNYKIL